MLLLWVCFFEGRTMFALTMHCVVIKVCAKNNRGRPHLSYAYHFLLPTHWGHTLFGNRKKQHQGYNKYGVSLPNGLSRTPAPTIQNLLQILSNGRTMFAPTVVRGRLLCRKIAPLFAGLHLIWERVGGADFVTPI